MRTGTVLTALVAAPSLALAACTPTSNVPSLDEPFHLEAILQGLASPIEVTAGQSPTNPDDRLILEPLGIYPKIPKFTFNK